MSSFRQHRRLQVEIAPAAWQTLGRVDRSVHQNVLRRLNELAEDAASSSVETFSSLEVSEPQALTVETWRIQYEIDRVAGAIRLLEVQPVNLPPPT